MHGRQVEGQPWRWFAMAAGRSDNQ